MLFLRSCRQTLHRSRYVFISPCLVLCAHVSEMNVIPARSFRRNLHRANCTFVSSRLVLCLAMLVVNPIPGKTRTLPCHNRTFSYRDSKQASHRASLSDSAENRSKYTVPRWDATAFQRTGGATSRHRQVQRTKIAL